MKIIFCMYIILKVGQLASIKTNDTYIFKVEFVYFMLCLKITHQDDQSRAKCDFYFYYIASSIRYLCGQIFYTIDSLSVLQIQFSNNLNLTMIFWFDLFFPLLSVDYAHNVNMSDSEFGTNGSDKGKSLTKVISQSV